MTADNNSAKSGGGNSKTVIALAAVGVLAIGAGGFVFMSGKGGNESATPAAVTETAQTEDAAAPAPGTGEETAAATEQAGEQANDVAPAAAEATAADATPETLPGGIVADGNPVVAEVGDEKITRSEVLGFIANLPEQVRAMPLQNLFPMALEQVVNNKIVSMKAQQSALEQDPEVVKLLDQAKGQIVRSIYVQREVDKAISEADLKKAYDQMVKEMGNVEEIHARQILVDSEDKAKEIITKLEGGANFEELAKENSAGPTAQNGGDLGFFAKGEMIPEFAEPAFALNVGEYTKTPVKTQFGWHIIKSEEKRSRPAPQLEEVKPQLEAKLRQEELARLLEGWQKDAKIKKFDINGKEIAAEPAKN